MVAILLSSVGTVVAAEKVSQNELVQECYKLFDAQAYADNDAWCNPDWVPENDCVYSGCWDDIVQDKWRCINAYETDMVNVPGYLECVNPHMDRYLECLKKANEKQRSIRVNKRVNNKGKFEPNFRQWRKDRVTECQEELFPAIETCQEEACIVYCTEKGAPGGEWSGSSWRGTCKCDEIKEEYTLTLKHYPPYYKPGKDDPRRAGDLVATLKDKNGKGVSGKTVFFYVEPGTNLKGVLENTICPPHLDWALIDYYFPDLSYFGDADTNDEGIARFNYIKYRCIKADILSERIRDTGENIKGPVVAAVFNQELTAIEQEASVVVEFSGVAKITRISVYGDSHETKGEERKIRVIKGDNESIPVYDKDYIPQGKLSEKAKCTPYHLLSGDAILLDKNDSVELIWITGEKTEIRPKPSVFEEEEICFAKLTIGAFDFDGQTLNKIYECIQDDYFSTVTLTGLGLCLACYNTPLGVSSIVIALTGKYFEEVPYVIMRSKSKILVDPTSSGVTFYTVEGSNELITPEGLKRNVTTGHKISVLPNGTFSQISEFERSELNEDLSYLLESIEKDESDKQFELEISKLYVEKPVYPRGTEVDVHYHVKNIGTVDVDEYHVEYKINDFKGNEMYKFVGSTHSIASGEQQKFIAAENWEIPSDAKIGPYIIDCTLIWDSKKDTAGREFFVTHPAKREDRTAELEISNLYTGKSEYLEGAGERVDVCYYVKNTGAVDISEYHVIYQIFDSEGKRYCWFISDMFGSIVAGKEDKWQSGVWKVPSDAKVGRYTVDAMVIWGLGHFSRETAYFFVN